VSGARGYPGSVVVRQILRVSVGAMVRRTAQSLLLPYLVGRTRRQVEQGAGIVNGLMGIR
jgi:hypothetical protein